MRAPARIPVRLRGRRYDVVLGAGHLSRLRAEVGRLKLGTQPVLLTNKTLADGPARSVARALGGRVPVLAVADTERSKSMATLAAMLTRLAALDGPGKRLFLVLVGGGVVGDLGGVMAGLYRRGIPYVQVPTTLLAQVDSSVGGKTAVDLPQGKNLAGLFYQPRLVFSDVRFLRTLPERQFRSGLAEAAKCGVIRDARLFAYLEGASFDRLRGSAAETAWVVSRAVAVKAAVVEADELETRGIRTLLNFGHTFGHALEAATGYGTAYTHGEAVSVGMVVATEIALRLRMIRPADADRIRALLLRLGLPVDARGVSAARILRAMSHDKKWSAARQRWVLPVAIGRAVVRRGVPEKVVREAMKTVLEG